MKIDTDWRNYHYYSGQASLVIDAGEIAIVDADGEKIIRWYQSDWVEDPSLVYLIADTAQVLRTQSAQQIYDGLRREYLAGTYKNT
jgi:hypothetical protein